MLSIFNMHIQFSQGEYLHFVLFFFLFPRLHDPPPSHTDTERAVALHLFTINTIPKLLKSDQNANGDAGNGGAGRRSGRGLT